MEILVVYINPLNSLRFVLNKVKQNKTKLDKDFYVLQVLQLELSYIKKGMYSAKIEKLDL